MGKKREKGEKNFPIFPPLDPVCRIKSVYGNGLYSYVLCASCRDFILSILMNSITITQNLDILSKNL